MESASSDGQVTWPFCEAKSTVLQEGQQLLRQKGVRKGDKASTDEGHPG
jgi:hypothetical protein